MKDTMILGGKSVAKDIQEEAWWTTDNFGSFQKQRRQAIGHKLLETPNYKGVVWR